MDRDFQEINAQLETDSAPDSARAPEQAVNEQCMGSYSPKEAAHAVGIGDRTVFKYADILIPLWGEEKIREDGLYTPFAVEEMKRIKELKPVRYEKSVRRELGLPEDIPAVASALVPVESTPFELAIITKASDRVSALRNDLAELEATADEDFGDFLALSAEIVSEDEAFNEQDDLEWQMLRKQNATKWLKRRAILERDKQQILQGEALPHLKK